MTENRKEKGKRIVLPVVIICLLALISTGGVIAYLMQNAEVNNAFSAGRVTCEVEETFINNIKSNVKVKNTGNTDEFIRAKIVVNWVSDNDDHTVYGIKPVPGPGNDYQIIFGTFGWDYEDDGYYYYDQAVAAGETTGNLIETCALLGEAPEGYHLSVEIIADAIQTEGFHDAKSAPW